MRPVHAGCSAPSTSTNCSPTPTASSRRSRATSSGSWGCWSSGSRRTGSDAVAGTPRVAGHRRRTPVAATPDLTSRSWKQPSEHQLQGMQADVVVDMGWGRLIFGQTFGDLRRIVDAFRAEESGERDICIYPRDPHVLVGLAP